MAIGLILGSMSEMLVLSIALYKQNNQLIT